MNTSMLYLYYPGRGFRNHLKTLIMTKYLFRIIIEDGTVILDKIKSGRRRVGDQCVIMSSRTHVEITNIYYENIETNSYVCGTNVQLKLKNIEEACIFNLKFCLKNYFISFLRKLRVRVCVRVRVRVRMKVRVRGG